MDILYQYSWSSSDSNSTKGAVLRVTTWLGHLALNRYDGFYFPGEEPKNVSKTDYSVDLNEDKEIIWRKSRKLTDNNEDIIKNGLYLFDKSHSE